MTSIASKLAFRMCLAVTVAALALTMCFGVTGAQAEGSFSGHLAGKTWTTNGAFVGMSILYGVSHTAGLSMCVTPAQYSGGWSFPYGWTCGAEPLMGVGGTGYPAADNPNSKEISFLVGWS